MLERFPAISFDVFWAIILVTPLAITGLVLAIQEKKAGKKGAVLGILLNLFALIAHKAELVSLKINTASGFNSDNKS